MYKIRLDVMYVAKGPSWFPADAAVKAAQQNVDDAIHYDRKDYQIKEAQTKLREAKARRDRLERTGE